MKISTILTATVLAATATLAVTPASADVFDRRQHNQQHRIEQGVRTGQITRHEHYRLQRQQAHISTMERHAARDGHIDRHERAHIRRAQNHASRHIYAERHDRQSRWSHWRRWW